jgi:hypothetical protein
MWPRLEIINNPPRRLEEQPRIITSEVAISEREDMAALDHLVTSIIVDRTELVYQIKRKVPLAIAAKDHCLELWKLSQ